jgi:hypothetical protein
MVHGTVDDVARTLSEAFCAMWRRKPNHLSNIPWLGTFVIDSRCSHIGITDSIAVMLSAQVEDWYVFSMLGILCSFQPSQFRVVKRSSYVEMHYLNASFNVEISRSLLYGTIPEWSILH